MKKILQSLLIMLFLGTAFNSSAQVRLLGTDPSQGLLMIKNFGTATVDITGHIVCSQLNYVAVSTLNIVGGSPAALLPGQTVWLNGFPMNLAGGDLALYIPGTSGGGFSNAANMLDYVQWKTSGNARESVAVSKGIWSAGAFVAGNPSYSYFGNGTQNGVAFWQGVPVSIDELTLENKISLFPNPAINTINIDFASSITVLSYRLVNLLGQTVVESNENSTAGKISVDVSTISKGNYSMVITTSEGVVNKKVVISQ
ncbi:MAG: hypothetical protein CVT95_04705 [Bacteroidetes bacterium HGW-Bacteroidetes-12]|nr:MAG: hypothetical protein CVT95_04705 [Bacteroidetes bacterium HGW-Bacteroidetes-12]